MVGLEPYPPGNAADTNQERAPVVVACSFFENGRGTTMVVDLRPPEAVLSIGELAAYTQISKYSLHVDGRRETREEGIARVMGMHRTKYADLIQLNDTLKSLIDEAELALLQQKVLGSQRMQQFGGAPVLSKNARGYNCCFSPTNRPRFFQEMFWLLLCGCGTGFSVQRHHVQRLPYVRRPTGPERVYVIPDTIEGWADALGVLLSTYFVHDQPFPEWYGYRVVFDASLVRPKGAPLSSGAKAPGPEPLLRALELARSKLEEVFEAGEFLDLGKSDVATFVAQLRPIHVYDIALYAADAVRSGGVRRSATIALFSHDDEEMAKAKTGDWWNTNPQRERANNSAVLVRGETTFEEYWELFKWTKEYGEPGTIWVDHRDQGMNPCVEASLWAFLKAALGEEIFQKILPGSWSGVIETDTPGVFNITGWQFCNLSTINMALVETLDDFITAARAAAVLGTLQAGYTDFGYLGEVSELITKKEALLGVSLTSMCDAPTLAFDPMTLQAGAAEVLRVNALVAGMLGINPAARTTLVKPEGTGTLTLGSFATGIHPWKHFRGIRHVGAGDEETPFKFFRKYNPNAVYERRPGDYVIAFPYEAPEGASIQDEVSALEMLRRVRLVQKNWVEPGRRADRCVQPFLMHNVSNTIEVADDEWKAVASYIYDHRQDFVGVSMLGKGGDKKYRLAPYTEVKTWDELRITHGPKAVAAATDIFNHLGATGPDSWGVFESFLNDAPFEGVTPDLLKDVELIVRWEKLRAETVPVPWNLMTEDGDEVDFGQEAACAGGACTIDWDALQKAAEAQTK